MPAEVAAQEHDEFVRYVWHARSQCRHEACIEWQQIVSVVAEKLVRHHTVTVDVLHYPRQSMPYFIQYRILFRTNKLYHYIVVQLVFCSQQI